MRDYAKIKPSFWSGPTGKVIRKLAQDNGGHVQIVALYLMTSPHANMIGLYHLPVVYMMHDTGLSENEIIEALSLLVEVDFCRYDIPTEMVWVRKMARHQVAPELKPNDKKVKGIQKLYDNLPECPFLADFHNFYKAPFHMISKRENGSPSEAPPKQGTGTGTEAGTETEVKSKAPVKPSPDLREQKFVRRFPVKGGDEFTVDGDYVESIASVYPSLNIEDELKRMLEWLLANPKKLKTKAGMTRFVTNWLNGQKDRKNGGKQNHASRVSDSNFNPDDEQQPEY